MEEGVDFKDVIFVRRRHFTISKKVFFFEDMVEMFVGPIVEPAVIDRVTRRLAVVAFRAEMRSISAQFDEGLARMSAYFY